MDWLSLIERYGIPLVVAGLFWVYIQKQQKYITEELSKELKNSFTRLESILIKLIDNSKKQEIKQEGLNKSFRVLVELISALSGNGLNHKFMNMLNNDDKNIILKRFNNHKLIFCGDLGYQLPPIEGRAFKIQELPVIEHHNNRRCKCRKLQRVLNFIRERIREDKDFLINLPGDYLFDIKIIGKDDFDYKVEDLIICPYNSRKDYFTEKYKDLEKYTVTANTTNYSNGDILYQKIKGVEMELRHAFTIHAIQGETAKNKLYIDLKGIRSLTMLYTAFSRAEYLDQISLFK